MSEDEDMVRFKNRVRHLRDSARVLGRLEGIAWTAMIAVGLLLGYLLYDLLLML